MHDAIAESLQSTLGFQYDIVRALGRGGMGAVYLAHERALDRLVAIKVLRTDVADTVEARQRFLREARTAAQLTHPNIVPLYTFGDANGLLYFVMAYVDGESVQARLQRDGAIGPAEAQRILEGVASALDYAHGLGIVHRDVKPDNILLEAGTDRVVLADFGIARRDTGDVSLTATGVVVGTPLYMSPEQATGDATVDGRSDVYSLGLVGYAMLTGRPPFQGANAREVIAQQVTVLPTPLAKLEIDAPPELCAAIERAIAKNPADRWATAGHFADAMRDEDYGSPLHRARRPGVYALGNVAGLVVSGNIIWYGAHHWSGPYAKVWMALFAFAAIGNFPLDFLYVRRQHLGKREVIRMLTQPPRWWPFWWPRAFRRADDVWDRLPADMRQTRVLASVGALLAGLGTQIIVGVFSAAVNRHAPFPAVLMGTAFFGGLGGALCLFLISMLRVRQWATRREIPFDEAFRIDQAPTGRAEFWKKPHIARLLLPRGDRDAKAVEPHTPAELGAAIAALSRALPEDLRELSLDAASATRQLLRALEALEQEQAALARDADPAEIARIEARVRQLDATGASGSEQLQMRDLLATQLDLMRRLVARGEQIGARRLRLEEMLRALWLQLSTLRANAANRDTATEGITDRIRDVCAAVAEHVSATAGVESLIAKAR